jgi:predicted extracellular nuclease
MSLKSKYACILVAGAMLTSVATPASAAVIISQYYEGASNNKFIELFNSGAVAVDLAAGSYQLSHWSNANRETWKTGGAPTGTQALTGIIPAGGAYVINHSSAAAPTYAVPGNQSNGSNGGLNFNGDDSVAVWTGTTYSFASLVDVFGAVANSFVDLSYERKSTIITGVNTDFNASDWNLYTLAEVADATPMVPQRLGYHAAVPEPATLVLGGLALIGVVATRRRG